MSGKLNVKFAFFVSLIFLAVATTKGQATDWRQIILRNMENRNADTLRGVYNAWAREAKPVTADTVEQQKDFIKETYRLFPGIVKVIYSEYLGAVSKRDIPEDSLFYYLPTSIDIGFSDISIDQYSISKTGKPYDSVGREGALFAEVVESGFSDYCLNLYGKINPPLKVMDFRPYLDSGKKIIYDVALSKFQRAFDESLSDYEIEKYLVAQGKSLDEIRKWKGGTFTHFTAVGVERKRRFDYYTSLRLNVKDRIRMVVFQPGFKTAVVIFYTGQDLNCCGQIAALFEKTQQGWRYKRILSHKDNFCYDGPGCEIR